MSLPKHPGANPACPHCKGLGLQIVRDGLFAVAKPCVCRAPSCPACADTGFVNTGEGFRSPVTACACRIVDRRAGRFNAAQIPGRYANATFATFDPRLGGAPSHKMVKDWVARFRPGELNRGLVLYGKVGRGKTHLAIAATRALILQHGVSARFVEFSHLLSDLKVSFDRRGGAAALLDPLTNVDVLVIDELGKGRNTEFEGTVLDEIVSRRYNAGATILGTTNFEPKSATGRAVANAADARATRPALVDRVGERVYSRIHEICAFLPALGEDYRQVASARDARRG